MSRRLKRTHRAERIDVVPIPSIGNTLPVSCSLAGIRPDEWNASVERDEAKRERRAIERMTAIITRELAKQAHHRTHTTEPL